MPERWLVIDDSATIQRVIKLAFQDYDVAITEAESCPEATLELSKAAPTLVIADAALAGVTSVHDFVALQQIVPQAVFVILEGSYDHIDESQFRSVGFQYFLKKPFDGAQLIGITRQALGRAIQKKSLELNQSLPLGSDFLVASKLVDEPEAEPASGGIFLEPQEFEDEVKTPEREPEPEPEPEFKAEMPAPSETNATSAFRANDATFASSARISAFDLGFDDLTNHEENSRDETPAKENLTATRLTPANFSLDEEAPVEKKREPIPHASLSGMLEPMLQQEMEKLVRAAVADYCREHFAELARELILRELERLTQERARLLVDK